MPSSLPIWDLSCMFPLWDTNKLLKMCTLPLSQQSAQSQYNNNRFQSSILKTTHGCKGAEDTEASLKYNSLT